MWLNEYIMNKKQQLETRAYLFVAIISIYIFKIILIKKFNLNVYLTFLIIK
jgi:hypothetical protein